MHGEGFERLGQRSATISCQLISWHFLTLRNGLGVRHIHGKAHTGGKVGARDETWRDSHHAAFGQCTAPVVGADQLHELGCAVDDLNARTGTCFQVDIQGSWGFD